MRYVVITPVRNEASHLQRTVTSMLAQTVVPEEWIIVDDGSTDGTRDIALAAASRAPWVKVVQRVDRGFRKAGAGVVEAFYEGFAHLDTKEWMMVVKLDGDLEFAPEYFERVISEFESDLKLGIAGGEIHHFEAGQRVIESKSDPAFHVRGANKAYRRECWQAIGGLFSVTGWDTLDEVKANMLGWHSRRIDSVSMLHLKPTGAADGSWKDAFKNGRGSYIAGYHPLFLLARAVRRMTKPPYLIISLGLCAGYISGFVKRLDRVNDPNLIRYLQRQQLNKLLLRPSLWSNSSR